MLESFGERIEANGVVLSGSFLDRAPRLHPGQDARGDFGPLGAVSARLAGVT